MSPLMPLREVPAQTGFSKNDVLVVFGEVFSRGYVNGLIDRAAEEGLKIIYSTVGRRDTDLTLRALNPAELEEKNQSPLINVPLEAGFDLEPSSSGLSPVDQIKDLKMSAWNDAKIDWKQVEESRQNGVSRFRNAVQSFMQELESHIPEGANVLFVHTMAGGFPRAKVVMPVANRVFKGFGPRYQSSKEFWESELGRLCDISFNEVTGETFRHLIELSRPLREKIESRGNKVRYVAYGYHGTEVLHGDEYKWQSYSPYLQGWAKLRLEAVAKTAWNDGIKATVYNAPEILTNSSSIFLGVEVVLYPLIGALRKEGASSPRIKSLLKECQSLLKPEHSLDEAYGLTQNYLKNEVVKTWPHLEGWPQHNGPEQMELMRNASSQLIEMHKDTKALMTAPLSEAVFRACGEAMFQESGEPRQPGWWVGHDLVAKLTR